MVSTRNRSRKELQRVRDTPPASDTSASDVPDAGLRSLDHYKIRLPPWRYNLRQKLLPLIRWETPSLAWLQDKMRYPLLDSYFAITANLGTHTFFTLLLPILFWCGHTDFGRGMVHILSAGVYVTSFVKDMLSLPRPLSPPLHRISMSGSAALEYGFPSTHSANAVSVTVYALYQINSPNYHLSSSTATMLHVAFYIYASSIVLGRLYCGMHGFLDVIIGSLIGVSIAFTECVYGPRFEHYLFSSSWVTVAAVILFIFALVRIHPEPADDCPCFDDTVACCGVVMGVEVGNWHYAASNWAWSVPIPATVPFNLQHMGWTLTVVRIVAGVLVIFAWRETMKPTLLRYLPHLFRVIERYGFILPRKYFMPASEYNIIPTRLKMDNVMPSVADLPTFFNAIRHPRRGRADSVGPQSAADAYETLAYREKQRRDSMKSNGSDKNGTNRYGSASSPKKDQSFRRQKDDNDDAITSGMSNPMSEGGPDNFPAPLQSKVESYENMMGEGHVEATPATPPQSVGDEEEEEDCTSMIGRQKALEEKEIFSKIEKPRTRYDVEVVTKLIVYTGIASLTVDFIPIIFESIGLGVGQQSFQPRVQL